jgi:phosphatidylserine/phosphatidylglycerophosphate/cardiolipin synthase-like enzyme
VSDDKVKKAISKVAKLTGQTYDTTKSRLLRWKERNPNEAKGTVAGGVGGVVIGSMVGGSIGVAGFFGAVGIPIVSIGAVLFAFTGNLIGSRLDRAALEEKKELLEELYRREHEAGRLKVVTSHQEHRDLLVLALKEAETRVCILCGWATSYVVDKEFKSLLWAALERGVNISIGYGYTAAGEPKPRKQTETEAEAIFTALLKEVADKQPAGSFQIRKFPNHQKILICDEKFAVCGSFNWLSNAGRSPNQERSWIVTNKEFIQQEWELILHELGRLYSRKRLFGREK